ncbi:MAG: hypothetical protein AB1333_03375 [Patescibacteria group bacterium]
MEPKNILGVTLCMDCGKVPSEVRHDKNLVPPCTVVYACKKCIEERINYSVENNGPKVTGREIELCVVCGNETEHTYGTNVDLRENYVEGVGQHCGKCG